MVLTGATGNSECRHDKLKTSAGHGTCHAGSIGDRAFKWLTLLMALSVFVLIVLIGYELAHGSHLALRKFGWRFLSASDWDPVNEQFGALPFIFGTLVSSVIALVIAVPLSIATAVYLTELAPLWLRQPLTIFIELLAAVPSVILGLWGIFVMVPWLREHLFPWLRKTLGFLPFFKGPIYGVSMLAGGIIIAIMILPIITSVSREILRSVPGLAARSGLRAGRDALGGHPHRRVELCQKGLVRRGHSGPGPRAGRNHGRDHGHRQPPQIAASLFAPGYTLASVIANEFTEATTDMYFSALFEIGLVLLGVTMLVNALAQLLLKTFAGPA